MDDQQDGDTASEDGLDQSSRVAARLRVRSGGHLIAALADDFAEALRYRPSAKRRGRTVV